MPVEEEVGYFLHTINEVITAMVTDNFGFNTNHDRPCTLGSASFTYVDCTGMPHDKASKVDPNKTDLSKIVTYDPNMQNLHWHLSKLDGTYYIPKFDNGLPFRSRVEYTLIDLPPNRMMFG